MADLQAVRGARFRLRPRAARGRDTRGRGEGAARGRRRVRRRRWWCRAGLPRAMRGRRAVRGGGGSWVGRRGPAVAGEQRYDARTRQRFSLDVPGWRGTTELGRDGAPAGPGSGEDGAIAGEPAEIGEADVVRATREHRDGDQRGELRVRRWDGQRGAGDRGVELAGSGLAEARLEDAVDGVDVGLDDGAIERAKRCADARVDLGAVSPPRVSARTVSAAAL